MRIDKWLWAARFFKTRSLAAEAVVGGKIRLDGQPVKPAKEVKIGDWLTIASGEQLWTVHVRGLAEQRRPAAEARLLFEETPESAAQRAKQIELRKLAPMPGAGMRGRPSKKDGRLIRRLSGRAEP
jgi:ribosome-associated heat shock protein Hsp15